jgi:phage host-nuclease inhibitor protein Gam
MLNFKGGRDEHEKFKELSALAASGNLGPLESSELQAHLNHCEECREVFFQYRTLATQGMTALADTYLECQEQTSWESEPARERLFMRVRADQRSTQERGRAAAPPLAPSHVMHRATLGSVAQLALAACFVLTIAWGAYHLGARRQVRTGASFTPVAVDDGLPKLAHEKKAADELLAAQANRLAQLQQQISEKEQELGKLRAALRALEEHSSALTAASSQSETQLRALSQQRDDLSAKLQAMSQAHRDEQTELASLRAERDNTVLRTSSLEAKIAELTARNRDQERRLKDTEQYLSSDRDIRELMGARKLYIADVFDVDGSSRTQKPFGRVFYTQGKSLIFYAFDLDHEPGVVNASTFQVWGQREAPQGEQALPMNLGILYMDNESNRRWVMRFDDPKQLAEIDAVFVTVEPRGGSHKPTSKPFLYALLRNEANHP